MLLKKEFYFVRHGQTDHNLLEGENKGDHTGDIPLNATGRAQATTIEPLIAKLPIRTICASPMKRAQETKFLIAKSLKAPHFDIDELGECSANTWREMIYSGVGAKLIDNPKIDLFVRRVEKGLSWALEQDAPTLIVAHGGVHFALCSLLGIEGHDWRLENCGVVHFSMEENGKWSAKKLNIPK